MTAQLADKLRPFGIDYVDAMDRFGDNAELYERLALKYLDDGHLVALQAAMEAKDYSEGYSQAHALKGVAGNLSFKDLYDCATLVSDAVYAVGAAIDLARIRLLEQPIMGWLERRFAGPLQKANQWLAETESPREN